MSDNEKLESETDNLLLNNAELIGVKVIDINNQNRLAELASKLKDIDFRYGKADNEFEFIKDSIKKISDTNRGGVFGKHGFNAEILEKGFSNIDNALEGKRMNVKWVNDNGMADLRIGKTDVQMKFCQKDYSLDAIKDFNNKYPDFIRNGGKFSIPKDYYEVLEKISQTDIKEANRIFNANTKPTLSEYNRIKNYLDNNTDGLTMDKINPSKINYDDAKVNNVDNTISNKEQDVNDRKDTEETNANEDSKLTLEEFGKQVAIAAAIEGGVTFVSEVLSKRKEKGSIKELTKDDWLEISKKTGIGTAKGAGRGAVVSLSVNYLKMNAIYANALVTATYEAVNLSRAYKKGQLTKDELIDKLEESVVTILVNTTFSYLGDKLIPVPVLGSIIGNTVGSKESKFLNGTIDNIKEFKLYLDKEPEVNRALTVDELKLSMRASEILSDFYYVLEEVSDVDYEKAFNASIDLCNSYGITALETIEDGRKYFNE